MDVDNLERVYVDMQGVLEDVLIDYRPLLDRATLDLLINPVHIHLLTVDEELDSHTGPPADIAGEHQNPAPRHRQVRHPWRLHQGLRHRCVGRFAAHHQGGQRQIRAGATGVSLVVGFGVDPVAPGLARFDDELGPVGRRQENVLARARGGVGRPIGSDLLE
ncbi:hypothetical protein A3649_15850 [Mycobacterium ulcerans]|nr:hypothetical protein A3649_15850 [Mycobacterium ulcerans]